MPFSIRHTFSVLSVSEGARGEGGVFTDFLRAITNMGATDGPGVYAFFTRLRLLECEKRPIGDGVRVKEGGTADRRGSASGLCELREMTSVTAGKVRSGRGERGPENQRVTGGSYYNGRNRITGTRRLRRASSALRSGGLPCKRRANSR